MTNANVNFEVVKIEKANKPNCVVVIIKFYNNPRQYTYVRRNYNSTTVIDGCRIYFDNNYQVEKIEREYETKGIKKLSTAAQVTTTGDKIKTELETKGIQIPKVEQEQIIVDEDEEIFHEKYEEIKMCLENDIPVYLAGPAGSGKNHTVEQIAKELDWDFYFSNSVQQEFKLTGFIDAGGTFHETEFYKACTSDKPSIFFLDEMDASIPEVLVLLNAAIANGYFEFPNGRIDFDHVKFVAAGNTVGSGADEMYTGRMVLDQATLDRFAIIEFDYSLRIELAITKNNTDLVNFIRDLRKDAEYKGVRATFSYRCLTMVTKLENAGMELELAIKIAVVKGLDKDTVNTLNSNGYTKYHKALKKVQLAA